MKVLTIIVVFLPCIAFFWHECCQIQLCDDRNANIENNSSYPCAQVLNIWYSLMKNISLCRTKMELCWNRTSAKILQHFPSVGACMIARRRREKRNRIVVVSTHQLSAVKKQKVVCPSLLLQIIFKNQTRCT